MSAETRSDRPMWWTYSTSTTTLTTTSTYATTIARPGTVPPPLELHLAQREHRVHERRDEESDCDLARLVAQERLDDPR